MCGHATFALGRFLVDTSDQALFPNRPQLRYDPEGMSVHLRIHAPCGVVHVRVPVALSGEGPSGGFRSDPSKNVAFLSVPSFPVELDLKLDIPREYQWPELSSNISSNPRSVTLDLAFGGAFYAIVDASQLGFADEYDPKDWKADAIQRLSNATRLLKRYIQESPTLSGLLRHPHEPDLEFLYGVTVVFPTFRPNTRRGPEPSHAGPMRSDVNLCFFASQQMDRSPTGSCVSARVAVDVAKKRLELREAYEYHSVVSASTEKDGSVGAFRGSAVEVLDVVLPSKEGVEMTMKGAIVRVEGRAFYTGKETFVLEDEDFLRDGFWMA